MRWHHYFITVITILLLSSAKVYPKEKCQPDFTIPPPPKTLTKVSADIKKNPVYVFFDGSLSMKGFVVKQPPQESIYINLLDQLISAADDLGSVTLYHKFGRRIEQLNEKETQRMTQQNGYDCPDSAEKCELDNKETRLDKVFKAITVDQNATYIVTSDLFLSSEELTGVKFSKMEQPLKEILRQGKTIGVLGVMNSFNGIIYDIPTNEGGTITYAGAKKRPFFVLIIGDQKNVNFVKKRLEQDSLMEKEEFYKFSLITSNVITKNLNITKEIGEKNLTNVNSGDEGYKFTLTDEGLPIFKFKISQSRDSVQFKFVRDDIIVPNSNDVAEWKFEESLWTSKETSCKKVLWKKAKITNFSHAEPQGESLNVNIFGKNNFEGSKLRWGWRYFAVSNLYTAKNGTASADKFKEWNIDKADIEAFTKKEPKVFKTLNLSKMIKKLNFVADEEFVPTLLASIVVDFELEK